MIFSLFQIFQLLEKNTYLHIHRSINPRKYLQLVNELGFINSDFYFENKSNSKIHEMSQCQTNRSHLALFDLKTIALMSSLFSTFFCFHCIALIIASIIVFVTFMSKPFYTYIFCKVFTEKSAPNIKGLTHVCKFCILQLCRY